MEHSFELGGELYEMERNENEIKLKRFDNKFKTWVVLKFPIRANVDKEAVEQEIIEVLSSQYIKRIINKDTNQNER